MQLHTMQEYQRVFSFFFAINLKYKIYFKIHSKPSAWDCRILNFQHGSKVLAYFEKGNRTFKKVIKITEEQRRLRAAEGSSPQSDL